MRIAGSISLALVLLVLGPSLAVPAPAGVPAIAGRPAFDAHDERFAPVASNADVALPPGLSLEDVTLDPVKTAAGHAAPPRQASLAPLFPGEEEDEGACASPLSPPVDCQESVAEDPHRDTPAYYDAYGLTTTPWTTLDAILEVPANATFRLCVGYPGDLCDVGTAERAARVVVAVENKTSVSIQVLALEGSGTYRLRATTHAWTLTPDCGDAEDAGNAAAQARNLSIPASCEGSLNPRDDAQDWFRVHVEPGAAATAQLAPNPEADFDVCAYKADATLRRIDCSVRARGEADRVHLPGAGDYYIQASHWSAAESYVLATSAAPPQDDCGTGTDTGSRYRVDHSFGLPLSCEATLAPDAGDAWDLVALNVTGQGGLRVHVAPEGVDVRVCLYPPGWGTPIQCSAREGASTPEDVAFSPMRLDGFPWRLGVFATDGSGTYALRVEEFTPAPQDDCGSGRDGGDHFLGPSIQLGTSGSCAAALLPDEGDTIDAYAIRIEPSIVSITFTPSVEGAWQACFRGGPTHCTERQADGSYRLVTEFFGRGEGSFVVQRLDEETEGGYALNVSVAPPTSDCGTGGDAADQGRYGAWITRSWMRCTGALHPRWGDDADWYNLTLSSPAQSLLVTVDAQTPEGFSEICVYRDGMVGQYCSGWCSPTCNVGGTETFLLTNPEPGTWHVGVKGKHSNWLPYPDTDYVMRIVVRPAGPVP